MACALVVFAFVLHILFASAIGQLSVGARRCYDPTSGPGLLQALFHTESFLHPAARAQAEQLSRETDAQAGALSPAAFSLSILRMVALPTMATLITFSCDRGVEGYALVARPVIDGDRNVHLNFSHGRNKEFIPQGKTP
jgi:hypothetical protein